MGGLRRRKYLYSQENTEIVNDISKEVQPSEKVSIEAQVPVQPVVPSKKEEVQVDKPIYNISRQKMRHIDKPQSAVQGKEVVTQKIKNTDETIIQTSKEEKEIASITDGTEKGNTNTGAGSGTEHDVTGGTTESEAIKPVQQEREAENTQPDASGQQSAKIEIDAIEKEKELDGNTLPVISHEPECRTDKEITSGNEERPSVIPQENTEVPIETQAHTIKEPELQPVIIKEPMDCTAENLNLLEGKTVAVSLRLPGNLYANLHEEYMYNMNKGEPNTTFVRTFVTRIIKAKKFIKPDEPAIE